MKEYPSNYRGNFISTELRIERAASGFFLVGCRRVTLYPGVREKLDIAISPEQAETIKRNALSDLRIAA